MKDGEVENGSDAGPQDAARFYPSPTSIPSSPPTPGRDPYVGFVPEKCSETAIGRPET